MVLLKKFNTEKIIKALKKTRGLVFLAAKIVGCDTDVIYDRAKKVEAVRRVINEARGEIIDTAESKLFAKIKKGDMTAINFVLRTIGKHRGYGDEVKKVVESTQTITAEVTHQHQIEIGKLPIELRSQLLEWQRNQELQGNNQGTREEPKQIEVIVEPSGNGNPETNGELIE